MHDIPKLNKQKVQLVRYRMVKDPVCGMVVDDKTALKADIEGRQFYFCSSNCMKTFANPEKELSKLKKRMYVLQFQDCISCYR